MRLSFYVAIVVLAACSGPAMDPDASTVPDARADSAVDGSVTLPPTLGPAARPATWVRPPAHDGTTALPAIVLLHGYAMDSAMIEGFFAFTSEAATRGFYLVIPDGTVDEGGARFWNATPACCDYYATGVDDVAYLTSLVDQLESLVPVSDLYFVGFSNGGYMSYRMACEMADRISAIASLAGSDFLGDADCVPSRPVSVLQMHGDADGTVLYTGMAGAYPSAQAVVERWAGRAGCTAAATEPQLYLDLDTALGGMETEVVRYEEGCTGVDDAALWTIRGSDHAPALGPDFAPAVFGWLSDHAR